MSQITTLSSQANVDVSHASDIINQAYKQVFGNKHMMELDKNPSIEALFMNGDLSVQGLITAMAQSDTSKITKASGKQHKRSIHCRVRNKEGTMVRKKALDRQHRWQTKQSTEKTIARASKELRPKANPRAI